MPCTICRGAGVLWGGWTARPQAIPCRCAGGPRCRWFDEPAREPAAPPPPPPPPAAPVKPRRPRFLRLDLLLVLLLVPLVGCPQPLPAAPAPFVRRPEKQPTRPPVCCTMTWHGVPYRTVFRPDGYYEAETRSGTLYVGSWRLDGRTLHVLESTDPANPDSWHAWHADLSPCLRRGLAGWLRLD